MSIDELDVIEAIEVTIPEAWVEARAKEEEEAKGSGCGKLRGYDETGKVVLPLFPWSWQDFLPGGVSQYFSSSLSSIPSLLEFIPEVSESLADGALWFNFVFDWWFTEPLHPVEEPEPTKNEDQLPWPCTRCSRRFHEEWLVSKHFIEAHLPAKPLSPPPPPPPPQPEPVPEPVPEPPALPAVPAAESDEEDFVYEFDPFQNPIEWRWQDFLPGWREPFLPWPEEAFYETLDIEDPDPDPPRIVRTAANRRSRYLVEPSEPKKEFVLKIPAPVLKQTKYYCKTCSLTICNGCFTRRCASHNVDWMGQAKFGCGAC